MGCSKSTLARPTFHIPIEITIEILSRLPVKSLLRFKSVCRTWYALLKTPYFVAQHAMTQSIVDSSSLLVTTYNFVTQNYAMSLLGEGFSNGPINLDFPFLYWDQSRNYDFLNWNNYFFIAGICNGLVCINVSRFGYPLFLCNPSTRQFREIPGTELLGAGVINLSSNIKRLNFGFGFHPSANDYKLIRIVRYSTPTRKNNIRADLYAMSSGTWREIDVNKVSSFFREIEDFGEYSGSVKICGSPALAVMNGVFCWPTLLKETNQVVVMSFDMGDEVFRKTRIPEGLDITWYGDWQMTEIYDKLALVVYPGQIGFSVWVLNEKESSWTKQVNFEFFSRVVNTILKEFSIEEVVGLKNGELLVTSFNDSSGALKIFAYDPKSHETKDLCPGQVPNYSCVYWCAGTILPVMLTNENVLD